MQFYLQDIMDHKTKATYSDGIQLELVGKYIEILRPIDIGVPMLFRTTEGRVITTSTIREIRCSSDEPMAVVTRNSTYILVVSDEE